MQQQCRFAGRRRALERLAANADDGRAALKALKHIAQRERASHCIELIAAFDQAWGRAGSRSAPSATTRKSASKGSSVGNTTRAAGSMERTVVCRNRTPGLSVAIGMKNLGLGLPAEHDLKL